MQILDAVKPLTNLPKRSKRKVGARTPEGKVKQRVKELLDELGCYWFMPVANGYSSSGVPDIIACVNGRFVGIETKSKFSSHILTTLQELNLNKIKANGGVAIVVNEDNVEELFKLIER